MTVSKHVRNLSFCSLLALAARSVLFRDYALCRSTTDIDADILSSFLAQLALHSPGKILTDISPGCSSSPVRASWVTQPMGCMFSCCMLDVCCTLCQSFHVVVVTRWLPLTLTLYCFVFQLLLYICGSKEKYRQLRDVNFLETHMSSVRSICEKRGCDPSLLSPVTTVSLSYDVLIDLVCVPWLRSLISYIGCNCRCVALHFIQFPCSISCISVTVISVCIVTTTMINKQQYSVPASLGVTAAF